MRQDIRELIQENQLCVLATASGGEPHCSLMSYAANDDCGEVYMATHTQTKKYRNLMANPSVSLLVDSRQDAGADPAISTKALTISGTFQNNVREDKAADVRRRLLEKHSELQELLHDPLAAIIVIKVSTVQLLDGIKDAYFELVS